MSNREKLKDLIIEIFLLDPAQFRFDLLRKEIEAWDSFGIVSMAVGVEETFGYHMTPDEAGGIKGIDDIIKLLETKGISFDE